MSIAVALSANTSQTSERIRYSNRDKYFTDNLDNSVHHFPKLTPFNGCGGNTLDNLCYFLNGMYQYDVAGTKKAQKHYDLYFDTWLKLRQKSGELFNHGILGSSATFLLMSDCDWAATVKEWIVSRGAVLIGSTNNIVHEAMKTPTSRTNYLYHWHFDKSTELQQVFTFSNTVGN